MKKYVYLSLCVFLFLIALVVYTSCTAQADTDLRITNASGFSGYSSMVTGPNGITHIVWQDNRTGNYEIFYNAFNKDKFIHWPEGLQLTNHSGDSLYPAIAIDNLGYIHVAWQDYRNGNWDIYYKKLDGNGTILTGDERVTNDSHDSIRPRITVDSGSNVHLVWFDNRYGSYQLFGNTRVEPDIIPTGLSYTPVEPFVGDTVVIQTTIMNNGNNSASHINITCVVDNTIMGTQTINILNAHTNQTLTFSWTAVLGSHDVKILADPDNTVSESNEDNNIFIGSLTVYRIDTYSNMSIWANATIKHSTNLQVGINRVNDPNASGTPNDIGKFVAFTANTSFDYAFIKIGYNESDLGSIPENTLLMCYWDVYDYRGPQWVPIADSGVNTIENYVWANVPHFTIFAPLATEPQPVPQPPTQPTDITAWHTNVKDLYNGIGGYPGKYPGQPYTYQSNSTETGNDLYFMFYWGDVTNTVVGPVTGSASATHIYALGTYSITATVKHGSTGTPSNPSTARSVTMFKAGDTNNDGSVSWRDIDPFVTAMNGKAAYYAAYSDGYFYTGDCNFDHYVNWRDIDPFVALMGT